MYAFAKEFGLTRGKVHSLGDALSYYQNRIDNTCVPVDTAIMALLGTAYHNALDYIPLTIVPDDKDCFFRSVIGCPFDRSMALVKPHPRPSWLPEPHRQHETYSERVSSATLTDWSSVLRLSIESDSVVIGAMCGLNHGISSERTEVYAFFFDVTEGDRANASDVFQTIDQMSATSAYADNVEFSYVDQYTLCRGNHLSFPLQVGDLLIYPFTCRLGIWPKRWHGLPILYSPVVLMPGTQVDQRVSSKNFDGEFVYFLDNGQIAARGYYWQDGMSRRAHRTLFFTGGFILEAEKRWLQEVQVELGLRLGWVRKTTLTVAHKYEGKQAGRDEKYELHNISRLILP